MGPSAEVRLVCQGFSALAPVGLGVCLSAQRRPTEVGRVALSGLLTEVSNLGEQRNGPIVTTL